MKQIYNPYSDEIQLGGIGGGEGSSNSKFATDIVFTAENHNTISWTQGILVLGKGEHIDIKAGSSTISGNTWIYYDGTPDLKTTNDVREAGQGNNILIGTAASVPIGNKAMFKIDGSPGLGVFIDGDQILAGSIVSNHIRSGSITADKLNSNVLTIGNINGAGPLADKGYINSNELNTYSNDIRNGVIIDGNGIRGYTNYQKFLYIDNDTAYFSGHLEAASGTFNGKLNIEYHMKYERSIPPINGDPTGAVTIEENRLRLKAPNINTFGNVVRTTPVDLLNIFCSDSENNGPYPIIQFQNFGKYSRQSIDKTFGDQTAHIFSHNLELGRDVNKPAYNTSTRYYFDEDTNYSNKGSLILPEYGGIIFRNEHNDYTYFNPSFIKADKNKLYFFYKSVPNRSNSDHNNYEIYEIEMRRLYTTDYIGQISDGSDLYPKFDLLNN